MYVSNLVECTYLFPRALRGTKFICNSINKGPKKESVHMCGNNWFTWGTRHLNVFQLVDRYCGFHMGKIVLSKGQILCPGQFSCVQWYDYIINVNTEIVKVYTNTVRRSYIRQLLAIKTHKVNCCWSKWCGICCFTYSNKLTVFQLKINAFLH